MAGLSKALLVVVSLVAVLVVGPAARSAEAPYESQLLRLAEILGSIHYLRNLCADDGGKWRSQMEALLEAEEPRPERRARLVASFNRGYRAFQGTYAVCTESAVEAIRRYMDEGETLTADIAARYGN